MGFLKYQSWISPGFRVYGGGPVVVVPDTRVEIPLDRIIDDLQRLEEGPPPFAEVSEILDPVMFNELMDFYAKLTPGEVFFLGTLRTVEDTFRAVKTDLKYWVNHVSNTFKRLRAEANTHADAEIDKEIQQAATDIRLVLDKLQYSQQDRTDVKASLLSLMERFRIAKGIYDSVSDEVAINQGTVLVNEVRQAFTSLLRLVLSEVGVVEDQRDTTCKDRKTRSYYISKLRQLHKLMRNRGGISPDFELNKLAAVLSAGEPRIIFEVLYEYFLRVCDISGEAGDPTGQNVAQRNLDFWLQDTTVLSRLANQQTSSTSQGA
jgi:hypothetical protein